jgi:CTP:molybdopterin cytidylyltransferase MocA
MTQPIVTGVVLAAGSGRRMGTPKAQLEIDGVRLLDRAIEVLRAGGCTRIVAVVRAPESLAGVLAVVNPDPDRGMGSSLRLALEACTGDAAVVTLVDTPGVGPEAVRAVAAAVLAGAKVSIATYGGTRGHPVGFGPSVWSAVAELADGDQGARGFMRANPELVVEVPSHGDPADIDTPEDLRRWRSQRTQAPGRGIGTK